MSGGASDNERENASPGSSTAAPEQELQPFIKTVQAKIDKLETMGTSCARVQAATSPNIVDAIAAAELPSLSSSGSESN